MPSSSDPSVALSTALGLDFDQCVGHCCTAMGCAAVGWTAAAGNGSPSTCATFALGFDEVAHQAQPSSSSRSSSRRRRSPPGVVPRPVQGAVLATPPADVDHIANGLRSGTYLGGVGTGGYELRADGTFHKSTVRNQALSAEPWQGVVRDAVLAVAVDGVPFVVRLRPFGNISAVPSLVYHDRFPLAKLSFLNMSLYAYSSLTPGDSNASNTPAVLFTLHATNPTTGTPTAAPVNVTFMVAMGLGLRNDWAQFAGVAGVGGSDSGGGGKTGHAVQHREQATSRGGCAAACVANASCLAWEWGWGGTAGGCDGGGGASAAGGRAKGAAYTELGDADCQAGAVLRNGNTAPKLATEAACEAACTATDGCTTGLFVTGTVRFGECWLSSALARNPQHDFCGAKPGESCAGFTRAVGPAPSQCRLQMKSGAAPAYTLGSNRAGVDSGNPGSWEVLPGRSAVFTTATSPGVKPYNGLGAQGLYLPAGGVCSGCIASVGAAASMEELLDSLRTGGGVRSGVGGAGPSPGPDALFAAAAVTVPGLAPGGSVSMTVVHAWHYPHFYWYRDHDQGSDNGVRYSNTYLS